jgi:hypothetical protein
MLNPPRRALTFRQISRKPATPKPTRWIPAKEERPQVRVVEPKGKGDGVAEVGQGLVGGQFQLAPDPPCARWGVEATEDADAEGVGGRGGGCQAAIYFGGRRA